MAPRDPTPASGPVAGQVIVLAKAEIKREAIRAGRPWGLLGGAGFAGYMVLLFASIAAWRGLAEVMAPGWAALIVTAIWAVIGAVLYTQGRRRLREVNLRPERTAETVSDVTDVASEAAGQARSAASGATSRARRAAGRKTRDQA